MPSQTSHAGTRWGQGMYFARRLRYGLTLWLHIFDVIARVRKWANKHKPSSSNSHFIIGCLYVVVVVRITRTHSGQYFPRSNSLNSGLLSMQTALFDHLDTSYVISGVMHYNAMNSSQEDWMFTQCFQLCLYISLCMHLYKKKTPAISPYTSTKFKCYIKKYSYFFFWTYSTLLSCVSANIIVSEPPFFWNANNPLQTEPQ